LSAHHGNIFTLSYKADMSDIINVEALKLIIKVFNTRPFTRISDSWRRRNKRVLKWTKLPTHSD